MSQTLKSESSKHEAVYEVLTKVCVNLSSFARCLPNLCTYNNYTYSALHVILSYVRHVLVDVHVYLSSPFKFLVCNFILEKLLTLHPIE